MHSTIQDYTQEICADILQQSDGECESDGIYLILQGNALAINVQDDFVAKRLCKGDVFGEESLLKNVGYAFFGDIVAGSERKVRCLYLSFRKLAESIPKYEQVVMRKWLLDREDVKMLAYRYAQRYNLEHKETSNFYGAYV